MSSPSIEVLIDALDHIQRVARNSRTQTRRLRWIAERARCAVIDSPEWKALELPPNGENENARLRQRIAEKDEMRDRALALADSYCDDFVRQNGVPVGDCNRVGMADVNGQEVRTLAETSEHFQEAAQWLLDRKLASIVEDEKGEVIVLGAQA